MNFKSLLVALTVASTLSVGLSQTSSALQAPATGQALEIAPPVLNLRADPGQTVTSTIQLRDVTSSPLIVRNQINDFVANGEDGTPRILLDENAEDSPYSLKDWVQPLPQFTLKPREINRLPLTIRVPRNAAPGGYYAVVRFTATPPGLEGTGVSLSASLGTLVLLRVNGDAKESMSVESFTASRRGDPSWVFESTPIQFTERIRNAGSTHEQPTGQVVVKDMFGNTVGATNVNLASNNVLPGSIRKFEQSFDSSVIGNKVLFGRYTASLTVKYGTNNQSVTKDTSFWVIPYRLIGIGLLVLIALSIAIRIALIRYRDRVIARTRSRRRRR